MQTLINKILKLHIPSWVAIVFFGTLLLINSGRPRNFVFDEIHYIPASKSLVEGTANLNYEHPPLAKIILGFISPKINKLILLFDPAAAEIIGFRLIASLFGLSLIWGIYRWMQALKFRERSSIAALWLTGFNFSWFVQSKIVMLEAFYVSFAIWGLYWIYISKFNKNKLNFLLGWFLIGCALATKWSALPFVLIAVLFSLHEPLFLFFGISIALMTYVLPFQMVIDLKQNDGSVYTGTFLEKLIQYHKRIYEAMMSLKNASHPYRSQFFQWPLLTRPMWYHFETVGSDSNRCIFAGGNPALYWGSFPFLFVIAYQAIKKWISNLKSEAMCIDQPVIVLALMFWVPFGFWIFAPRSTQYFYYYFAPALWLGPIFVWANENYAHLIPKPMRAGRTWGLTGFLILCGVLFIYFLPIMDARIIPIDRYQIYMWFQSWV